MTTTRMMTMHSAGVLIWESVRENGVEGGPESPERGGEERKREREREKDGGRERERERERESESERERERETERERGKRMLM